MALKSQIGMIAFYLTAAYLISTELIALKAAAKSDVLDAQSWFRSQRRLAESNSDETPSTATLAVEMIPRHHSQSPFYRPGLSRAERVVESVKRSRTRAMAISRRLSDTTLTSPADIFVQEGEYIFRVMLGTPPQKFEVLLDTGSDLPWVQCKGCNPCTNQSDPYFNPDASSTYAKATCDDALCNQTNLQKASCDAQNTCVFDYHYLNGSETVGYLSMETLTLLNSDGAAAPQESFHFGCGYNQTGAAGFHDVDGIFGLGPGPLSMVGQLASVIDYKFSYCLVRESETNVTDRTSTLLLGSEGNLPLNYTPFQLLSFEIGIYFVNPRGFSVGGVNVSYDPHGTFPRGMIMDSGHPLTLLNPGAYEPILKELKKQISYKVVDGTPYQLELCYDTSTIKEVDFPVVEFRLRNLTLTPDPNANIFQSVEEDDSVYCLTIAPTASVNGTSILGNIWQQNYQIAYDLKNSQVGFAATTCGM